MKRTPNKPIRPRVPYAHLRYLPRPPRVPTWKGRSQEDVRRAVNLSRSPHDATLPRTAVPIDVAELRYRLGLTQTQFAKRFGIAVRTLRHWERREREPQGPAKVLLTIIDHNPGAVMAALAPDIWK